jgi:hypothetical protein
MGQAYQEEVGENLNYCLQSTPYMFRGRGPISFGDSELKDSISFIGAAQSFGVWCEFPYPVLVANALSMRCFNLAHGGAGPRAFLLDPRLVEDVNKTRACVIQVMSGRSTANRYMKQHQGTCVVTLTHPNFEAEKILSHTAWAKLFAHLSTQEREALAQESISDYLESYRELKQRLKVPLILLWISSRSPDYTKDFSNCSRMLGSFPHLIDREVWNSLSDIFENRVIAHSERFMTRPLWSQTKERKFEVTRSWGTIKCYDPSYTQPYLHILAAQKLLDKIHELNIPLGV